MKNQFVKLNALQDNVRRQSTTPAPDEQIIAVAQPDAPIQSPQKAVTPGNPQPSRSSTGLLSNWARESKVSLLAEQETLKHPAMQGPVTEPATISPLPLRPQRPGHSHYGHVSPHASGITPQAAVQAQASRAQGFAPPREPFAPPPGSHQAQQMSPARGPLGPGGLNTLQSQPQSQAQASFTPFAAQAMAATAAPPRGGAVPPRNRPSTMRRKKRRVPIWARVVLAIVLLLLVGVGSAAGYYYYNFSAPVSHIVGQNVNRLKGDEDPNQGRTGDILGGPRINILLLGSDTDVKFTNADGTHTYLAQTDIIVTVDPATKQVSMLSIPRDFYINVPGYGMHKLDEAYALGGVALSRLTIFQDFGIPINYYAWVGLDGFIKVINTVGGVDVDVLHPITDDTYPDDVGNHTGDIYAYKRLYIPPGPQHLNGPTALEYVRSRHADLVGDFGRSARQQQVLSALKLKLNNPDIISKLPDIAHDLDGFVKTDMQLTDVLKVVNFARGLDQNKINRVILDPPYSSIGSLPNGTSVVFPHCDQILPVISKLFQLGDKAACNIQANSGNSRLPLTSTGPVAPAALLGNQATWQTTGQLASTTTTNLVTGNTRDPFGVRSLLDLMLLVACNSPQALQL